MYSQQLRKEHLDALLIIYFDIGRTNSKRELDYLVDNGCITPKHGGGWLVTSRGRRVIKDELARLGKKLL